MDLLTGPHPPAFHLPLQLLLNAGGAADAPGVHAHSCHGLWDVGGAGHGKGLHFRKGAKTRGRLGRRGEVVL